MGSLRDVPNLRSRRGSGSMLWVRALRAVLWLLVAAGPILFLVLTVQVADLRSRIGSAVSDVPMPVATSRVEGFAEVAVADFLTFGDTQDGGSSPSSPSVLASTASLGATEVEPGYFSVLVAARMLAADTAGPHSTSFFQVGVVEAEGGLVVAGRPALVARPVAVEAPRLLVEATGGVESPGLEETVARFFDAHLAGVGELDRYTTPDSPLRPVNPTPFTGVEVVSAGEATVGEGTVVAVTVSATDAAGGLWEFDYWLDVVRRDGRWEIVDLLAAPPLEGN